MLSAATAEQFSTAAGAMLASAQDPHLWTSVQGRLAETTKRRFTLNVDRRRLPMRVPQHRRINDVVATGRFPDDIGYIEVLELHFSVQVIGDPLVVEDPGFILRDLSEPVPFGNPRGAVTVVDVPADAEVARVAELRQGA
jgi:hypothetical protein